MTIKIYTKYTSDQAASAEAWGAEEIQAMAFKMGKHLHDIDPITQGAIIGEIAALWVAGHHPSMRETLLVAWTDLMTDMVATHAKKTDPIFAADERKHSVGKPH